MSTVSVRDLRNKGGEVLGRVLRGEHIVITRDGDAVADLRPLGRRSVATSELIARRRALPPVDPQLLRQDLDAVLDPAL